MLSMMMHKLSLAVQICIVFYFIWRFYTNKATRNSRFLFSFAALFVLEFELFLLLMSEAGLTVSIPHREVLIQYEWLLLGLFWREVLFCYEIHIAKIKRAC